MKLIISTILLVSLVISCKEKPQASEEPNPPLTLTTIEVVPTKTETKSGSPIDQNTSKMTREEYAKQFNLIESEAPKEAPETPGK